MDSTLTLSTRRGLVNIKTTAGIRDARNDKENIVSSLPCHGRRIHRADRQLPRDRLSTGWLLECQCNCGEFILKEISGDLRIDLVRVSEDVYLKADDSILDNDFDDWTDARGPM